MKMTKVIKKIDVIKALQIETLRRGKWFQTNKGKWKKNCKVCAVGAVLRKVSFEKWARKNNISLGALGHSAGHNFLFDVDELLYRKEYLAALSNYFEAGNSKQDCIAFVKENFPKEFTLTINLTPEKC